MTTYARYTYYDWQTKGAVTTGWYKVEAEKKQRRPSGLHTVVLVNGQWVKACYCEFAQVFTK